MLRWVDIVKGQCIQIPICMGKTGASPSPRALLVVEQILAAHPLISISMKEILKKYRFYQAIASLESNREIMLNRQKNKATNAGDIVEAIKVENLMKKTINNLSKYEHFIDMLFSHGPPDHNLTGRTGSLESAFRYIGNLSFSEARKILHQLLTSVYFREVAIFNLALMALRGQFADQDARGTCIEKVDSDLATAWASKLTDQRLLIMYAKAKSMDFYDLWCHKFDIWMY
jgi:hypothetical protein